MHKSGFIIVMLKAKLEAFIPQQLAWDDFSEILQKLEMKYEDGYAKDLLRFCAVELPSRIDGGLGRALKALAAARNRLEPQLPKHLHWHNLTSLVLELNEMPSLESFEKLLACHPQPLQWALKQMKRKILSYLPTYWPEILENLRLNVHQVLALTEPLLREALEAQDTPLAKELLIEKRSLK